jgi:NADH-quinone oxidoreductase subunit E
MKVGVSAISREERKNILIELKASQAEAGYVSEQAVTEIAASYNVSVSEVYGVATFYSFLCVKPTGRNVIRICQSLPCHLKDGENVRKRLCEILGIEPGETTSDGRFSLEATNCIGACDMAPAMLVNGELVGTLTVENIGAILEAYR